MSNATLLINRLAIDNVNFGTSWIDISDYVMTCSNFDQVFNNYDFSLRDTILTVKLSDLCDSDNYIKAGTIDISVKIVQDNKTIFVGYIDKYFENAIDMTVELQIPNVIHRLFNYDFTYLVNELIPDLLISVGANLNLDGTVFNTYKLSGADNLIQSLFLACTGYTIETNECYYTDVQLFLTPVQIFFNFGTGTAQDQQEIERGGNKTKISDFYSFICSKGILIVFNPVSEKFEMIKTTETAYKFATPADATIDDYNSDANISMLKNVNYQSAYTDTFADYKTPGNPAVSNNVTENSSTTNPTRPDSIAWVSSNYIIYSIADGQQPGYYEFDGSTIRFNSYNITTKKYLTDFITDFVTVNFSYSNISGCQAVFKNGVFLSEVELFQWVT